MKKKLLILSPINQYGGVNMDVAYLSQVLSKKHTVKVISLANYFEDSSVYYFNENLDYTSLNKITFNSSKAIRFLTKLVSFFKPLDIPNHFRVNNLLTKPKPICIEKIKLKYLSKEIQEADAILICSQLTAKYNCEIVTFASDKKKTILLKTTGQINSSSINSNTINWLKKVDAFIFHSHSNQKNLNGLIHKNKCIVIDQHAYLEDQLLSLPIKKKNITNFFTLSRLHAIKQIDKVIDAFNTIENTNLILNIYGDGHDEDYLKKKVKNNNIKFHGKVSYHLTPEIFKANDCLIIASSIEAGPYTGIESMASGIPIISTIVGAMEERLGKDYPFFYDGTTTDLIKKAETICSLKDSESNSLSQSLRETYKKSYNAKVIEEKYISTFNKFI